MPVESEYRAYVLGLQRGCVYLVASATLLGGCVGAHGTRARAVAIDGTLLAVGGAALALAFNAKGDDVWGYAIVGVTATAIGGGGLVLTGISKLGESMRDAHFPRPVFAVRPFTPLSERTPFDASTVTGRQHELATEALTQARSQHCDEALDAVDRLWTSTDIHAAISRDPAIAGCIEKAFAP